MNIRLISRNWLMAVAGVTLFNAVPNCSQDLAHQLASAVGTVTPKVCRNVRSMRVCHTRYPAGCNSNGKYDAYLSFLKNQTPAPTTVPTQQFSESDFNVLESKVPDSLSSSNHANFAGSLADLGEGNIYSVVGYLYFVKQESREACNCQLTAPNAVDYHMWVGFDAQGAEQIRNGSISKAELFALKQKGVVVEMTPHYRAQFHPQWRFDTVNSLVGRQVKVVGQLMLDNDHFKPNQDCGRTDADRKQCWRATVWEIHPVIEMYVCNSDTPCGPDSTTWKRIDEQ